MNPTANGLLGIKQTRRGIPVRAKSNPSVTTTHAKRWFGSAPKSEEKPDKEDYEDKNSQSSGSLTSNSSSSSSNDGDEGKGHISEDCRSESAFILRPPPGPKLKRRLAKPRPDEIILVDEYDDDSEAFNTDDGGIGTTDGSNRIAEVLQLQAVCTDRCSCS